MSRLADLLVALIRKKSFCTFSAIFCPFARYGVYQQEFSTASMTPKILNDSYLWLSTMNEWKLSSYLFRYCWLVVSSGLGIERDNFDGLMEVCFSFSIVTSNQWLLSFLDETGPIFLMMHSTWTIVLPVTCQNTSRVPAKQQIQSLWPQRHQSLQYTTKFKA